MRYILLVFSILFTFSLSAQSWDTLNAHGQRLYNAGHYGEAVKKFNHALQVASAKFGKISMPYTTSLSNLAYVYKTSGNLTEASRIFKEVLALTQKRSSAPPSEVVEANINLANVLLERGQYDSCEYYLQVAQDGITKAPPFEPFSVEAHHLNMARATILNSWASLKRRNGQTAEGLQLMEQLLLFLRETYPHQVDSLSTYRTALNNLTNYYLELGMLQEALQTSLLYSRLVAKYDSSSVSVLYSLQSRATLFRQSDQPDSAFVYWQRALDRIGSGKFEGTEIHLTILNNMGELHAAIENYDAAIPYLVLAKEINEKRGGINPRVYQTTLFNLAEAYHWSGRYAKADSVYKELVKQLLLEVRYNFTYLSEAEKIAFFRSQLSILESYCFFALSVSGKVPFQKSDTPYHNQDITQDLYDLQVMTKGLILNSTARMRNVILNGTDETIKSQFTEWELLKNELANLLKSETANTTAIEDLKKEIENLEIELSRKSAPFVRGHIIKSVNWKAIQQKLKPDEAAVEMVRFAGGLLYGALILTKETTDRPALVIIKSKENRYLEKEYYKQYINAINFKLPDTASYDVYWRPVMEGIRQHMPARTLKRIYFSPDGIYNQLNINTLFDVKTKQYVIDQVELHQLTNTKLLVEPENVFDQRLMEAVLVGRPAFTFHPQQAKEMFTDLKETENEVAAISKLLKKKRIQTQLFTGVAASEMVMKNLPPHSILHLATHGFFEQRQQAETESLVDVLMNSGIALAGANHPVQEGEDDGILTAYETLALNLDATQLVILSACETGLGEFFPGEGVYGLRQSLMAAGARTSVMSLWKVDDLATQKLMTTFYTYWLANPTALRQAFKEAQVALRKQFPEPYYWGAFVLSGR